MNKNGSVYIKQCEARIQEFLLLFSAIHRDCKIKSAMKCIQTISKISFSIFSPFQKWRRGQDSNLQGFYTRLFSRQLATTRHPSNCFFKNVTMIIPKETLTSIIGIIPVSFSLVSQKSCLA